MKEKIESNMSREEILTSSNEMKNKNFFLGSDGFTDFSNLCKFIENSFKYSVKTVFFQTYCHKA